MKGLIIAEPWIDYILDGRKIWEIRSSNIKIRGRIALIKKGTLQIWGYCDLIDCKELTEETFNNNYDKHLVPPNNEIIARYNNKYAWVLTNVERIAEPIPYNHRSGAVIWVNID